VSIDRLREEVVAVVEAEIRNQITELVAYAISGCLVPAYDKTDANDNAIKPILASNILPIRVPMLMTMPLLIP
jgi:hypothetical protein